MKGCKCLKRNKKKRDNNIVKNHHNKTQDNDKRICHKNVL